MKFATHFQVGEQDIDEHGHVNNVAYLRWIQDVAVAHWQSAASEELQKRLTWFVVRHEIDYRKRAFDSDEVTAMTWVGDAGRIKCHRFTKLTRGGDLLVEARSTWCLVSQESLRPQRIPKELKELFSMTSVEKLS